MAQRNCRGDVVIVTCPTVCEETPEISLSNNNLSGIGVLDSWSSPTGAFRGVVAGNSMVTVTLDNVNHTIVVTPQAAAIAAALPAATTSQVGVLETATDAEALAKSATDKIVTPSNFAAMGATTSFAGLIEIATLAEVQAGTATNLAVVPDTLGDMNFLSLANAASNVAGGPVSVDLTNGNLTFSSPGGFTGIILDQATLDFTNSGLITFGGLLVQDALIGTDSAGVATSYDISNFVSVYNTQTGWGTPTGILARTTFAGIAPLTFSNPPTQAECDAAGVQISILSQRLAALITDLKLVRLPAT
jgi:hypothetical protein